MPGVSEQAAENFKRRQAAMGMGNKEMARLLRKSPQSISNYRNCIQAIPDHVWAILRGWEQKNFVIEIRVETDQRCERCGQPLPA